MTKKLRIAIIATSVILVLAAILALFLRPVPEKGPKEIANAGELYEATAKVISAMDALSYRITETKTVSTDGNQFTEQSVRSIRIRSGHQGISQYLINETLSFGTHQISATEFYTGESIYLTIEGGRFSAPFPGDIQQCVNPVLLLTPTLYTTVTGYESQGIITVKYSNCISAEAWLNLPDTASVNGASGAVSLDKEGNLLKIIYEITYQIDGKTFRRSFVSENAAIDPTELPECNAPDTYRPVADIRMVKALERASGYLISAESVGTNYSDRISCEVFGDVREQSISLQTHTLGDWSAQMNTTFTLSNATKAGADTTVTQSEAFKNGTYTISINGSEPEQNPEITTDTMKKHCHDLLVGTIALPYHITEVTANQSPDTQYIEFTLSEDFAQILREELSQILYQNSNLFSNYEDNYATDLVTGHLTVDAHTGLPLSSGFQYRGVYTIDGMPYALEYSADQTYTYPPA